MTTHELARLLISAPDVPVVLRGHGAATDTLVPVSVARRITATADRHGVLTTDGTGWVNDPGQPVEVILLAEEGGA